MITVPLISQEGKQLDTLKLDEKIFNDKIFPSSVYQTIKVYRANQRKGLASTKTRGEVSGGGKKPWRQKGTGRARVGSIRSPLWRHGGVVFGPHPRDFSTTLPTKMKALSLRYAITQKAKENNLFVIDNLKISEAKTQKIEEFLKNLNLLDKKKILFVLSAVDSIVTKAARNIKSLKLMRVQELNTYDTMNAQIVIITKEALDKLTNRLQKK
ncbi:MAG: 50S ribosomal protein L4 [Candidatus Omnitrophica bacterium]|nr:50S ribosomal protein L4 [Candidatus Omnitrophota bacterium]